MKKDNSLNRVHKLKKIGILGGMGPEASAKLYDLIIRLSQEKYSAVQDTEYPPMVINSIGLEGFDETGIVNKEQVLKQLISENNVLYNAGCDFIVMACNTVHYFIDELRKHSKIPVLSIVEEIAKKIKFDNIQSIGLLASQSSYELGIYNEVFSQNNIKLIIPDDDGKKQITKLVLEVMGNNIKKQTKNNILSVIECMKEKSIEAVVLGCTELPLAIKEKDAGIKTYDTLFVLAESAVDLSFYYWNK